MTMCPYCHAEFANEDAYIAHDIRAHSGLERMRDGHHAVCERGDGMCFCNLANFERVAKSFAA